MSLPWWEFVLRALAVFFFLILILRLTGKRQMGQLAPFDLVLLLILSNSLQNSMNGGDNSLVGGIISAMTLIGLNQVIGYFSARNQKVERLLEGEPKILVQNGKCIEHALVRENISREDLDRSLRQEGLEDLKGVKLVVLETNGMISIIRD